MTTFSSIVLKIVVKDHVLLKILYIVIFCGIEVPCSLHSCWRDNQSLSSLSTTNKGEPPLFVSKLNYLGHLPLCLK